MARRVHLIDVRFESSIEGDAQLFCVTALRELVDEEMVDVSHLVPPSLRFTGLAHLQRFLETRTGDHVNLVVL